VIDDKSKGLHTDFSCDAVRARVLDQTSGLAPHERPGHRTPQQRSECELAAPHAEKAISRHDLDDGIDHT